MAKAVRHTGYRLAMLTIRARWESSCYRCSGRCATRERVVISKQRQVPMHRPLLTPIWATERSTFALVLVHAVLQHSRTVRHSAHKVVITSSGVRDVLVTDPKLMRSQNAVTSNTVWRDTATGVPNSFLEWNSQETKSPTTVIDANSTPSAVFVSLTRGQI